MARRLALLSLAMLLAACAYITPMDPNAPPLRPGQDVITDSPPPVPMGGGGMGR